MMRESFSKDKDLNDVFTLLTDGRLAKAMDTLENYLLRFSVSAADRKQGGEHAADMEALSSLREDYRLMSGYWKRGFADPQRDSMYAQLLRRMFHATANAEGHRQQLDSPFLMTTYRQPRQARQDWSVGALRASLEDYVSQVALLQLEPEAQRHEHSEKLHREHQELMNQAFSYIVTSQQWRQEQADAFVELLLSPTLFTTDQQLLVSAVMMSALQVFCPQKWRTLAEVCHRSTDEQVHQRALVGWALTAAASGTAWQLFPEVEQKVAEMCADEQLRQELEELQMQLVYCTEADADTQTIQQEILPEIMNGNHLKITPRGIVETDEDSLEDILHPETSEENMERMEQSMKRMVDMQRQGADIYFGGFSQMKRFPFFSDFSNWFVPFYPQHPAVSQIWKNSRGKHFLKAVTRLGAFCDSDKYSFVLAFNQVLDRLPASLLKMIEEGEAAAIPMGGEVSSEEQQQPSFMRRLYMQDLYRFYRVFPARSDFYNPFSDVVFLAHPLFRIPALNRQALTVARFLVKRRRYEDAVRVLTNRSDEQSFDAAYYLLLGTALQRTSSRHDNEGSASVTMLPVDCFRKALALQPDNERAKAALARTLFANKEYEEAQTLYEQLLLEQPDHRTYQLNSAVCQLNMGQAEEALKVLYKLDYMFPDDLSVQRVMAWTLTVSDKQEQAEKIYLRLIAIDVPVATDMLNYGYCLWMQGRVGEAISMFRQYTDLKTSAGEAYDLEQEFLEGEEHVMLASHGISDSEIHLMIDAL